MITLKYECNHEYEVKNPDRPCGSVCKYCGKLDPSVTTHEWDSVVLNERTFDQDRMEIRVCRVCKNSETVVGARAYFWYVLYGAGGLAAFFVVLGLVLAAVARKRRRQTKNR